MKKIPSLFKRNHEGNRQVYDEIVPGSEWVLEGEGVPTRKWDGTACLIRDGKLYKRYTFKPKGKKQPPDDFEAVTEPDPNTGKVFGWVPVGDGPEDQWHRQAVDGEDITDWPDGTYELIGPKVQGGAESSAHVHRLVPHGADKIAFDVERSFAGIRAYLELILSEGIVWHHPDGRMVKIKRRDFGWPWPVRD